MNLLPGHEPLAQETIRAIRHGDVEALARLLDAHPGLAQTRLVDAKGVGREVLHLACDWPGHFPRVGETITLLIARGANLNPVCTGGNAPERPLHGAASSDDVEAIDALLDGGADIEADGAIFTGGAAMSDAVIFAQWNAARRLLARRAKTTLTQAAALGLFDRVAAHLEGDPPTPDLVTAALWHACRGGQLAAVKYLVEKGADINWLGWDHLMPIDCALQSGKAELVAWLRARGAKPPREL
ncbi:MAG: ankyrin repeat domain-containing protein [Acidobacteria bacterium]|nr:ankyrin repeat domain-containing protein [Acidobacteriota bacterium]